MAKSVDWIYILKGETTTSMFPTMGCVTLGCRWVGQNPKHFTRANLPCPLRSPWGRRLLFALLWQRWMRVARWGNTNSSSRHADRKPSTWPLSFGIFWLQCLSTLTVHNADFCCHNAWQHSHSLKGFVGSFISILLSAPHSQALWRPGSC